MANVETRCRLEGIVVSKLEERGWTVVGGERNGLDLDLHVELQGTPGRVCFRNALDVPKGMANAAPDPCFVRIDLGEPRGEPRQWALWDRYIFESGRYHPPYIATVVHEACGDGWASVAGGDVSPNGSWRYPHRTVDAIIAGVELLAPGRDEKERLHAIWRTQRHNYGAQRKKLHPVAWAIIALVLFVAPAAFITALWLQGGQTKALVAGTVVASVPILGFLTGVLVALIRHARRPRDPLDRARSLVGTLRASGAFDAFDLSAAKVRDGLPVVVRSGGRRGEGRAPLAISRVTASSSRHGVTLSADVCEVSWPDGVDEGARFLPDWWLTIDLTGPVEELAALPAQLRAQRRDDTVRWLFTGDEVDGGEPEQLFRAAAASLSVTESPYR